MRHMTAAGEESITEEMVRYYDARASQYDVSMQYDNPEVVSRHMAPVHQLCQWLANRTVLEIACGPGFWTSRVAPATHRILATDVNESTLNEARKKSYPPGRVEFRRADAYALDEVTAEGRFDAAFACDWFSHIPVERLRDFLQGLTRHLMQGAHIAFVDQLPNERSVREGSYYDTAGNHIQPRELPGAEPGDPVARFGVIKNFPTEAELHAAVAPFSDHIEYQTFPECRRWMLRFKLRS